MPVPALQPSSAASFTPRSYGGAIVPVSKTSVYSSQGQKSLNYNYKTPSVPQQAISQPPGNFQGNPKYGQPTPKPNQPRLGGNPNIPQEAPYRVPHGYIDPNTQKTPSVLNPRQSIPSKATSRSPNLPSNGSMIGGGLGAGAILGALQHGLSGGDPIEGAVRGAAGWGGSVAGGLLMGGLVAGAGIPIAGTVGVGLILTGGGLAGWGASSAAGSIYGAVKRGLGFKDPDGIIDNGTTPVHKVPASGGEPGQTTNLYNIFSWQTYDGITQIANGPIYNRPGPFTKILIWNQWWIQRWQWYDGNGMSVGQSQNRYDINGREWLVFTRVDGTSEEQDIEQDPAGTPSQINNVTNNIATNYNYPSNLSNTKNDTPTTLGNKTPVVNNPNSGNKPVNKSVDTSKPQNRSSNGSNINGKRQNYQGADGYSWTLTRGSDGVTYISSEHSSNKVDGSRADVKESIKQFNKLNDSTQNPNNQLNNNLNSTNKIYSKIIDGEQISSNNTPETITLEKDKTTPIINANQPNPTNTVNPIPDNNTNSNRDSNSVINVINTQQKQGEDLVNSVVNPPVNNPVPESQQNQDYTAMLEKQNNIISMLALGTGATWLASQFSGVTTAISSQTPTPCQWTADRTTVLTNQQTANTQLTTANTTLGVVTNTQLVGINSTVTSTNAIVTTTNTTVNTINTTTNTIASGVTGLINTIGTATSTATNTLFGFVTKSYKALYLDRVYNAMSFLMQVHNTAMLSRNVGESLGYLLSNTLSIFGIKDENDQPLDFGEILGNSVENFIKSIVGEDTYNGASMQWKRLSSIYSAVANIYDLILQNLSGLAEGIQIVGNYTGNIGNALKKGGVVLENAYEWMQDNFKIKTGRLSTIERINEGLESIENTASELTEVTEVWIEGRESITEINEQANNIKEQMAINVAEKLEAENTAKTASQSPTLANSDLITPEPD